MNFSDSYGSASIVGQRDHLGHWRAMWHGRLRFPGEKVAKQFPTMKVRDCMLSLAVPICAGCKRALDLDGAERAAALAACKKQDCRRLAERRCAEFLLAWTNEAMEHMRNPPAAAVPAAAPAPGVATVDDLLAAWSEHWPAALDATAGKEARRNATSFMRVLAFAFDSWTEKTAGDGRRGVKVGERQWNAAVLGAMPLADVLTKRAARDYFERACAAAGIPCSWAPSNARAEYVTINRTLAQARGLFTKLALAFVFDGRVEIPDSMMAWKTFQLLPMPEHEIEPIVGADFARLVAAREAMKLAEPKLYLCAKVLMQTGLRSGSVAEMRGDWAVVDNGKLKLHVKEVKSGTVRYAVPITPELHAEIAAFGTDYCFGETEEERLELVKTRHNAWLKQFVQGPKRGSQGNHRLRKTLASAVLALRGIEAARIALGHADKMVTEASYAAVGVQVTPEMRAEFAAFLA